MSFVTEKSNNTNTTREYSIDILRDDLEALKWIYNLRNIYGITTNYLYFCDLNSRSDKGSQSIRIDSKAELESVSTTFKNRNVDLIFLSGRYHGKSVIIGVDLRDHLAYITIRKKNQQIIKNSNVN